MQYLGLKSSFALLLNLKGQGGKYVNLEGKSHEELAITQ